MRMGISVAIAMALSACTAQNGGSEKPASTADDPESEEDPRPIERTYDPTLGGLIDPTSDRELVLTDETMKTLMGGGEGEAQGDRNEDAWLKAAIELFPHELIAVPGDQALEKQRSLRESSDTVPIILGPAQSLALMLEPANYDAGRPDAEAFHPRSTEDILDDADRLSFPDDYRRLVDLRKPPSGEWPRGSAKSNESASRLERIPGATHDLDGEAIDETYIVLVPDGDATAAPAVLRYGGWNDYPPPDHHVAALRSWRERFGATLIALTYDQAVFEVERPPQTRAEALALAEEFYLYCPDTIDQGAGDLKTLASMLLGGEYWVFWWD